MMKVRDRISGVIYEVVPPKSGRWSIRYEDGRPVFIGIPPENIRIAEDG